MPLLLELLDELVFYLQLDQAAAPGAAPSPGTPGTPGAAGAADGHGITAELAAAVAAEAAEQIAAVRPTAEPAAVNAMQAHLDATLAHARERWAACAQRGADGADGAARLAQLLAAVGMPPS